MLSSRFQPSSRCLRVRASSGALPRKNRTDTKCDGSKRNRLGTEIILVNNLAIVTNRARLTCETSRAANITTTQHRDLGRVKFPKKA